MSWCEPWKSFLILPAISHFVCSDAALKRKWAFEVWLHWNSHWVYDNTDVLVEQKCQTLQGYSGFSANTGAPQKAELMLLHFPLLKTQEHKWLYKVLQSGWNIFLSDNKHSKNVPVQFNFNLIAHAWFTLPAARLYRQYFSKLNKVTYWIICRIGMTMAGQTGVQKQCLSL